MKMLFLMILLTRNGAGDINAAFVNTVSRADCQQRMSMVRGIFSTAGVDVVAGRCIRSGLRFSEFEHAASSSQQRDFYLIELRQEAVRITPRQDWHSCMSGQRLGAPETAVYCSSTVQRLLK